MIYVGMSKTALKREKWTLSFDADLKAFLIRTARGRGVYPVTLIEQVVRERFNPFGHTEAEDSVAYVRSLRRRSRKKSDASFLEEIADWQRSGSS